MRKLVKTVGNLILKIILLMIVFQTIFVPISNVEASNFIDDIISQGDEFLQEGKNNQKGTLDQAQLKKSVNQVYTILFGIGTALSVAVAAILGIKFMIGSVEDRAEYKKTMMPVIIGIVVLFTSTTIVSMIYNLMLKDLLDILIFDLSSNILTPISLVIFSSKNALFFLI